MESPQVSVTVPPWEEQSLSLFESQPEGQQLSSFMHEVNGEFWQVGLHVPWHMHESIVHESWSLQSGQLGGEMHCELQQICGEVQAQSTGQEKQVSPESHVPSGHVDGVPPSK